MDIDILLFGNDRIDCQELTVPHKLMWERDFVMVPLREVALLSEDDRTVVPDAVWSLKEDN